jgi:hypothetical protein
VSITANTPSPKSSKAPAVISESDTVFSLLFTAPFKSSGGAAMNKPQKRAANLLAAHKFERKILFIFISLVKIPEN